MKTTTTQNVFRDVGFAPEEAEHLRVRAALMAHIARFIRRGKLTQAQAARLFGVSQPRVSDVVRGRLHRFSIDALVSMLAHAGLTVRVRVGAPRAHPRRDDSGAPRHPECRPA